LRGCRERASLHQHVYAGAGAELVVPGRLRQDDAGEAEDRERHLLAGEPVASDEGDAYPRRGSFGRRGFIRRKISALPT